MVAPNNADADVVVIGGGPAGSAAATVAAQKGLRVTLFERERFPRFHIGESLIPDTYWALERLGMLGKLKGSHFVKKRSVQFVTDLGRLSEPFYFSDRRPHESSQTWQVLRSEFDEALLNNARDHGVDVREGVRVLHALFDGDRCVGVRAADGAGERDVPAQVVIDASGQSSVIMSRLGLREWDAELKKAALWTYWKGAKRDTGKDEGATLVLQTAGKKGWFWYIPLHDDVVSVGVVADFDYLFKNRPTKDHGAIYAEEVDRCPGLKPRLEGAERVAPFRAAKEYSYRSRQAAGDGWVLAGDAFGFLDPLYSSGVQLALHSGVLAGDAAADAVTAGDTSGARLGSWAPEYVRGMERMRRLVCAFYDGFNFGRFVRAYPHLKGHLTDLLMGDLFKDSLDEVWEPMEAVKAEMRAEALAM